MLFPRGPFTLEGAPFRTVREVTQTREEKPKTTPHHTHQSYSPPPSHPPEWYWAQGIPPPSGGVSPSESHEKSREERHHEESRTTSRHPEHRHHTHPKYSPSPHSCRPNWQEGQGAAAFTRVVVSPESVRPSEKKPPKVHLLPPGWYRAHHVPAPDVVAPSPESQRRPREERPRTTPHRVEHTHHAHPRYSSPSPPSKFAREHLPPEDRLAVIVERKIEQLEQLLPKLRRVDPAAAKQIEEFLNELKNVPANDLFNWVTLAFGSVSSFEEKLNEMIEAAELAVKGKGRIVHGMFGTYLVTRQHGKPTIYVLSIKPSRAEETLGAPFGTHLKLADIYNLAANEAYQKYLQTTISKVNEEAERELKKKINQLWEETLKKLGVQYVVYKGVATPVRILNPKLQEEIVDELAKKGIYVIFRNGVPVPFEQAIQKYGKKVYDIIWNTIYDVLNRYLSIEAARYRAKILSNLLPKYGYKIEIQKTPRGVQYVFKPTENIQIKVPAPRLLSVSLQSYKTSKLSNILENVRELMNKIDISSLTYKQLQELKRFLSSEKTEAQLLGDKLASEEIGKYLKKIEQRIAELKKPISSWEAGLAGFASAFWPTIATVGEALAKGLKEIGLKGAGKWLEEHIESVTKQLLTELERAKLTGGWAKTAAEIGSTVGSALNLAQIIELASPLVSKSAAELIALRRELEPGITISTPIGKFRLTTEDIAQLVVPVGLTEGLARLGARIGGRVGEELMGLARGISHYYNLAPEIAIPRRVVKGIRGLATRLGIRVTLPRLRLRPLEWARKLMGEHSVEVRLYIPEFKILSPKEAGKIVERLRKEGVEVPVGSRLVQFRVREVKVRVPKSLAEKAEALYKSVVEHGIAVSREAHELIQRGSLVLPWGRRGSEAVLKIPVPLREGVYTLKEVEKMFGPEFARRLVEKGRVEIPSLFLIRKGTLLPAPGLLELAKSRIERAMLEMPTRVGRTLESRILEKMELAKGEIARILHESRERWLKSLPERASPLFKKFELRAEKVGVGVGPRAERVAIEGEVHGLINIRGEATRVAEMGERGLSALYHRMEIALPTVRYAGEKAYVSERLVAELERGRMGHVPLVERGRFGIEKIKPEEVTRLAVEEALPASIAEIKGGRVRIVTPEGKVVEVPFEEAKKLYPTLRERIKTRLRELGWRARESFKRLKHEGETKLPEGYKPRLEYPQYRIPEEIQKILNRPIRELTNEELNKIISHIIQNLPRQLKSRVRSELEEVASRILKAAKSGREIPRIRTVRELYGYLEVLTRKLARKFVGTAEKLRVLGKEVATTAEEVARREERTIEETIRKIEKEHPEMRVKLEKEKLQKEIEKPNLEKIKVTKPEERPSLGEKAPRPEMEITSRKRVTAVLEKPKEVEEFKPKVKWEEIHVGHEKYKIPTEINLKDVDINVHVNPRSDLVVIRLKATDLTKEMPELLRDFMRLLEELNKIYERELGRKIKILLRFTENKVPMFIIRTDVLTFLRFFLPNLESLARGLPLALIQSVAAGESRPSKQKIRSVSVTAVGGAGTVSGTSVTVTASSETGSVAGQGTVPTITLYLPTSLSVFLEVLGLTGLLPQLSLYVSNISGGERAKLELKNKLRSFIEGLIAALSRLGYSFVRPGYVESMRQVIML